MRVDDRSNAFRDWLMTGLVMAIAFGVYLMTMCRSVSFIDAGELAAVACVMGIAHPTGYPLFTLTAHLAETRLSFSTDSPHWWLLSALEFSHE